MVFARFLLAACLLGIGLHEIHGHGMMLQPVMRSSAWRKGFPVEPNYSDNQLNCGGLSVQFEQNHGKCGECGDDYALPRPRPNENGGVYGNEAIVAAYRPGEVIEVNVKLTANHKGTFKFDLCALQDIHGLETDECFERYPLKLVNGDYEVPVPYGKFDFWMQLLLPRISCQHCVLRWTYRSGNNWGECGNGTSALGCGPQETFKNCADITIG